MKVCNRPDGHIESAAPTEGVKGAYHRAKRAEAHNGLQDAIPCSMTRLFHTLAQSLGRRLIKPTRQTQRRVATVSACLAVGLSGCAQPLTNARTNPPEIRNLVSVPGSGRAGTALVVEPTDGVKPVIRAIDSAGHSVFLEAYMLTQRSIVRSLQRAAAQGVAVFVLLDPHPYGMGNQPAQMAADLRAAGVSIHWTSRQFYFTHAKFFVVDDRLAVVSTANFSQAAFKSNRELLVVDRDRADVHDLSNVFRSDWDHIPVGQHNSELVLSPGSRSILSTFLARARRSIEVYAEEVDDPVLDSQLIRLHRRVRVEVLVARSYTSPGLFSLQRAGVAVRGLRHPYIHAKMFLEDGRIAFIGSENLSPTSLDLNREVGILVRGPTVTRASRIFALDWSQAVVQRSARAG